MILSQDETQVFWVTGSGLYVIDHSAPLPANVALLLTSPGNRVISDIVLESSTGKRKNLGKKLLCFLLVGVFYFIQEGSSTVYRCFKNGTLLAPLPVPPQSPRLIAVNRFQQLFVMDTTPSLGVWRLNLQSPHLQYEYLASYATNITLDPIPGPSDMIALNTHRDQLVFGPSAVQYGWSPMMLANMSNVSPGLLSRVRILIPPNSCSPINIRTLLSRVQYNANTNVLVASNWGQFMVYNLTSNSFVSTVLFCLFVYMC